MKIRNLMLILGAGLILAGCKQSNPEAEKGATEAAVTWLELIDSAKYAESWEQSATPFRKSTTAEGWGNMVKPIREPMGKVVSRKVATAEYMTSLPNGAKGEFVMIQFKTDFENKKGTIETVTPMMEDGKWKVSGYFVR